MCARAKRKGEIDKDPLCYFFLNLKEGEKSMSNIKGVHEEHKRSALKTISWRIIATSTTMFLVYVFTGQLELTAGVGIGDAGLKVIFYFLHERGWNRITFGRSLGGTVKSAMRSPPVTALPSDTVSSIVQKLITFDIGAVIVTDGNKHYGLITERDILKRVLRTNKDPTKTFARDIMSSPLTTVEYNKSLTHALKIVHDKRIRRLVATQKGKVVGILTERRILEALI